MKIKFIDPCAALAAEGAREMFVLNINPNSNQCCWLLFSSFFILWHNIFHNFPHLLICCKIHKHFFILLLWPRYTHKRNVKCAVVAMNEGYACEQKNNKTTQCF